MSFDVTKTIEQEPDLPQFRKWYDKTGWVVASLIFFWPAGVYALYKNQKLGFAGKFVLFGLITSMWMGVIVAAGIGGYYYFSHREVPQPNPATTETDPGRLALMTTSKVDKATREDSSKDVKPLEKKQPDPEKKTAEDAKTIELSAKATRIKEQAEGLVKTKKQHAADYEKGIADYNTATNPDAMFTDIEMAFRSFLKDKYNTGTFDEARFNEYFTADFVLNYNTQLKRKQSAATQSAKDMQEKVAKTNDALKNLAKDLDEANAKLAEAGKPKIEFPAPDAAVDKQLDTLREKAENAPARSVTLAELRTRIGGSVLPKRDVAQTDPVKPGETTPTPTDAGGITAADIHGTWTRASGVVIWSFEQGGTLSVRGKGTPSSRGSWMLDDATSTLSVTQGGSLMKFKVVKSAGEFSMTGGAGNASSLKFTKSK